MTITLLTLLLISNALSLRTDKSILFSRVVMVSLIHTSFLAYNNLFFLSLDKGIGIFGGLFHVTVFTQAFNIFIFILTGIILTLTSFYPIKAILKQISSFTRVIFIFLSLIIVSWIVGFTHLFLPMERLPPLWAEAGWFRSGSCLANTLGSLFRLR